MNPRILVITYSAMRRIHSDLDGFMVLLFQRPAGTRSKFMPVTGGRAVRHAHGPEFIEGLRLPPANFPRAFSANSNKFAFITIEPTSFFYSESLDFLYLENIMKKHPMKRKTN